MADDSLITSGVSAVITTVIGLIILRIFRYFEKRDKMKEEELKDSMKSTTDVVKVQLEKIMQDTMNKTKDVHIESNAQLKANLLEKITKELQDMNVKIKNDLETKTDIQSKILLNNIGIIENKLTAMINSLDVKSSITTENVSKMRNDILEIQEEIDGICDKLMNDSRKNMDTRDRKRANKRQEIKDDSYQNYYPHEHSDRCNVMYNDMDIDDSKEPV